MASNNLAHNQKPTVRALNKVQRKEMPADRFSAPVKPEIIRERPGRAIRIYADVGFLLNSSSFGDNRTLEEIEKKEIEEIRRIGFREIIEGELSIGDYTCDSAKEAYTHALSSHGLNVGEHFGTFKIQYDRKIIMRKGHRIINFKISRRQYGV